jgi:hypothetical protein
MKPAMHPDITTNSAPGWHHHDAASLEDRNEVRDFLNAVFESADEGGLRLIRPDAEALTIADDALFLREVRANPDSRTELATYGEDGAPTLFLGLPICPDGSERSEDVLPPSLTLSRAIDGARWTLYLLRAPISVDDDVSVRLLHRLMDHLQGDGGSFECPIAGQRGWSIAETTEHRYSLQEIADAFGVVMDCPAAPMALPNEPAAPSRSRVATTEKTTCAGDAVASGNVDIDALAQEITSALLSRETATTAAEWHQLRQPGGRRARPDIRRSFLVLEVTPWKPATERGWTMVQQIVQPAEQWALNIARAGQLCSQALEEGVTLSEHEWTKVPCKAVRAHFQAEVLHGPCNSLPLVAMKNALRNVLGIDTQWQPRMVASSNVDRRTAYVFPPLHIIRKHASAWLDTGSIGLAARERPRPPARRRAE